MSSTGTPAIGLPDGSSTLPCTVIRPSAGMRSSSLATAARLLRGLGMIELFRCRWRLVPVPGAARDHAQEQQRQRDELRFIHDQGTEHLLARAAAAGEPVPPAAKRIAAFAVASQSEVETDAEADLVLSAAASAATGSTTPRRMSPRRSLPRARASRLRTVPAGHSSRRPASSRLRPSK